MTNEAAYILLGLLAVEAIGNVFVIRALLRERNRPLDAMLSRNAAEYANVARMSRKPSPPPPERNWVDDANEQLEAMGDIGDSQWVGLDGGT